MTVDRQRELIASEASKRIAEDIPAVPSSGAPCRVSGCAADTRLGTLQGGGPMLCGGFPLTRQPCIARWLMDTEDGDYTAWAGNQTGWVTPTRRTELRAGSEPTDDHEAGYVTSFRAHQEDRRAADARRS